MRTLQIHCLMAALFLVASLHAEKDFRSWTSTKGTAIEAKLVRVEGDQVILEGKDGRVFSLKKSQLSAESQAQLEVPAKEKKPMKKAPRPAPTEKGTEESGKPKIEPFKPSSPPPNPSSKLPVETKATAVEKEKLSLFEGGRWKNYHAVYQCEKFDALVNAKGLCVIYFKNDQGQRLTSTHNASIYIGFLKAAGTQRSIEWVASREAAQRQPEKLRFFGEAEGGVKFEYTLIFKGDTISWYGHADKRNTTDTERFSVSLRVSSPYGIDKDNVGLITEEEAKTIVGDSQITFRGFKDEDPYHWALWEENAIAKRRKTNAIRHHLVDLELSAFAPRTIHLETDQDMDHKNRPLLHSYQSRIMVAFQISNRKTDIYSDDKDEVMKMTVK